MFRWFRMATFVVGDATLLGLSAFKIVFTRQFSYATSMQQCYLQANRSLFFLTVTMAFMGAIMIIQACLQAVRLVGDLSSIGPGFLDMLINLFAPTIGGIMIATRVGAGIAAELGTMAVTEQTDALKMCGKDPVAFLVAPRMLAGVLMLPLLTVWASLVAFVTAGLVANNSFHVAYDQFFNLYLVDLHDVITGLIKAVAYGVAIPVVSSYFGLRARGGATGVGNATTYAVIGSILTILVLDFSIGGISYLFR